jgi:hypothetical protein
MFLWPKQSLLLEKKGSSGFFAILLNVNLGSTGFSSFGALGKCAKCSYASSPTTQNTFFSELVKS